MDSVLSWFILFIGAAYGMCVFVKCVLNAKANRMAEYESALEKQFNAVRVDEWREFDFN